MKIKLFQIHLDEVDSTNNVLKDRCGELPDATFLSADFQRAGRGRLNRKWHSPRGENVYASFLMKSFQGPFTATLVSSVSVVRTLRHYAPDGAFHIKWPNDVYSGERAKIAGILSEYVPDFSFPEQSGKGSVIAGMGVNVNSGAESLSSFDQDATSLFCLLGRKINLKNFTEKLAETLEECYISGLKDPDLLFSEWKRENFLIGRQLEFLFPGGERIRSEFADIARNGEALIRMADGSLRPFGCGDVRVIKESMN